MSPNSPNVESFTDLPADPWSETWKSQTSSASPCPRGLPAARNYTGAPYNDPTRASVAAPGEPLRIGVVTDIHSNLVALETVLADMGPVDELWCLGDIVGYGPWPNECVSTVRQRASAVIAGNHDLATIGSPLVELDDFNADAASMTQWTASQLSPESSAFLEELTPIRDMGDVTLAHGSPRRPVWEYLLSSAAAAESFEYFRGKICLVGHTHIPSLFVNRVDGDVSADYMQADTTFEPGEQRCIANPGSVGQPRDHDPRAAYLILDQNGMGSSFQWRRVSYDVPKVQTEMRRVGLPPFFIERLELGV